MAQKVFLHADLDAFFASVEQLDYPEYRGKPVIVGGKSGDRRSVVSTCSYEARAFGVHSAMPMAKAVQLCPHAVFVRGRMDRYHEKSQEVMDIFSRFSPDVQQLSIDEAFIDLTGTERLFGTAEEASKKLKNAVKNETGLTVSAGAASNKYIAKIASGLSKPDGLHIVMPGEEESFMLSLPLEKLWGAGEKTRQRLNQAGFFTISDIHRASLNALRTLFGEHTAFFLYNAVRGREVETFSEQTKSKSVSAEHTYSFDILDRYVLETGLMELSSHVMFRLLREGWTTKTVQVKIRYEDFSTVSVQETYQRPVTSSDDLFDRASKLFYRKYDGRRGIRLLGVGTSNLEREGEAQRELFDFGDEKKQRVEKAVLAIETKNPSVKISKARFLNTILFCTAAVLMMTAPLYKTHAQNAPAAGSAVIAETSGQAAAPSVTPQDASAATKTVGAAAPSSFPYTSLPLLPSLRPESPSSLYSYSADDESVEFFAEGFWETTAGVSSTASFTTDSAPVFSLETPYIDQNVDLSLWFFLNNAFYFEAAFADDFEKNSIAAGYYGTGAVKHVRAGNSAIIFPDASYTSAGIGGGDNIGPGICAHFEGTKWSADAAVRYDILESYEKEYAGSSEITAETYNASMWERGRRFALPDAASAKLIAYVYVYDKNGSFTDAQGITYRRLESSEFLVIPSQCLIVTAQAHTGAVCASFFSNDGGTSERDILKTSLGTYGDPELSGSEESETGTGVQGTLFLGSIQSFFGSSSSSNKVPDVSSFSYGGTDNSGYFTQIFPSSSPSSKEWAVILQNPPYFSPFAVASFYKLGQTEPENVDIVSIATDLPSSLFAAETELDSASFTAEDFTSAKNYYAQVYAVDSLKSGYSAAQVRYPFAAVMPELYLYGTEYASNAAGSGGGFAVKTQTYSDTEYYDIGTDAVPGTVQVRRNGILDAAARYDQKTGRIMFASKPSSSEKIRITWQETDLLGTRGAVSSAAGFKYNFTKTTFADAVISSYWSWTPDALFSTPNSLSPGSVSLKTGFSHTGESLSFKTVFSISASVSDTSGMMRVLGMDDDDSSTIYLNSGSAYSLSPYITPSLNSRSSSLSSLQETFPVLYQENRTELLSLETKRDSEISGYAADCTWSFSSAAAQYEWTSFNIDLSTASSALQSAARFDIDIKFTSAPENIEIPGFDVYLQLGVDSGDDVLFENSEAVPTWRISRAESQTAAADIVSPLYFNPAGKEKNDWQTVTISLTDTDRSMLSTNQHARIIIVKNTAAADTASYGLRAGPYRIYETSFASDAPSAVRASSFSQSDTSVFTADSTVSALALKLNSSGTNMVHHFTWMTDALEEEETVSFTRYLPEISIDSFSQYSFLLFIPSSSAAQNVLLHDMTVTLDRPDDSGLSHTALSVTLPGKLLEDYQGSWQLVTADLDLSSVKIGQTEVSGLSTSEEQRALCTVSRTKSPVRLTVSFSRNIVAVSGSSSSTYTYIIDELFFSEAAPSFSAGNVTDFSWKKSGALLKAGKYVLFSDAAASGSNTAVYELESSSFTSSGSGSAGLSTILARLDMQAAYAVTEAVFTPVSAGHTIASPAVSESGLGIFKYLSFSENFASSFESDYAQKKNAVKVSIPSALPFSIFAESDASLTSRKAVQKASAGIQADAKGKHASYSISVKTNASQSLSSTDLLDTSSSSYGSIYAKTSDLQFSQGFEQSQLRNAGWSVSQSLSLPSLKTEPSATASGSVKYKADADVQRESKTGLSLSVPFTIEKQRFSLSAEKNAVFTQQTTSGGSYADDIYEYGIQAQEQAALIFSTADITTAAAAADTDETVRVTSSCTASWIRPQSENSIINFFVPASLSFAASRDITTAEDAADTESTDVIQLKGAAGFAAFNCFGKAGKKVLFRWYDQDEFIHSLQAVFSFPEDSSSAQTWIVSGTSSFSLFFTKKNVVKNTASYQIHSSEGWNVKTAVSWKRPAKFSLAEKITDTLLPRFASLEKKTERTSSCTVSVTADEEESLTASAGTSHEENTTIGKYFTLKTTAELSAAVSDEKTVLTVSASVSGKFSF